MPVENTLAAPVRAAAWEGHCGPRGAQRCGADDPSTAVRSGRRARLEVVAAAAQPQAEGPAPQASTVDLRSRAATQATLNRSGGNDGLTYDAVVLRRQKASIDIFTQEGDRVQVSFRSREALALSAGVADGGGAAAPVAVSLYAFAAGRVEIAVQGALSDAEQAAIGKLMEEVDALATQFFAGDIESAFAAAAQLGFDGEQLAGFTLKLALRESARVTMDPAPAPAPAPAPESEVAPAQVAAAPAASHAVADRPAVAADAAPVEESAPPPVAPGTQADTSSTAGLQQTLGGFLRQVLASVAEPVAAGRLDFSMNWKLRVVLAAVESAPQAAGHDPAGRGLLADSLQALATHPATPAAATAAAEVK